MKTIDMVPNEELEIAYKRLVFHIENTSLGFIEWDNQLNVKSYSKRASEILGWSEQEFKLAQKNALGQVNHNHTEVVNKISQDLLSGKLERNTIQYRNITKDGRVVWCDWFNSVLKDQSGKVVTITSFIKDISDRKANEEKLKKINQLYAFISQVNQNIVHIKDEKTLFSKACQIAIEFGKFKMAWIGMFDKSNRTISLVDQTGIPEDAVELFYNADYEIDGPQDNVLRTSSYFICTDIGDNLSSKHWNLFAEKYGIISCMVLPIWKSGEIIGTLSLYSTTDNFTEKEEIDLLVELTGDISFALDLFEQEKLHKATQDQLAHNEKQFRTLIEFEKNNLSALINNTSDLMWSVDLKFNLITFNKPFYNVVRLVSQKDLSVGDNVLTGVLSPGQLTRFQKAYRRAFAGEAFTDIEHVESPESWLEISYCPIREGEEVIGAACHSRDITERKRSEQRLIKSESRLKEAQAIASMGNWEVDLENKQHTWSDEMFRIFGIQTGDVVPSQEAFMSFVFPKDRGYVLTELQNTSQVENSFFEFRFVRRDGVVRCGYGEWGVAIGYDKKPTRLFGIIQDITERKQAELERIKIVDHLISRNKDLEQFSYIVSHNLRAPVANILGIVSVLNEMKLNSKERDELSNGLYTSATKLDEVVSDLNNILQVRNTEYESKELVNFSKLVIDIITGFKHQIDSDRIKITVDFSEIDQILTIKSYLYSIFYNLISNSIKYRRPEIITALKIKSHLTGNKVTLIFVDNGMGIDLEKRGDQVFGLYKRFHTHVEGKGMGLFITKTQVETLGGKISVKSSVNEGTEIAIEFNR